jgi:hypothetical protein
MKIGQVLVNLLTNSADAVADSGGRIASSLPLVPISGMCAQSFFALGIPSLLLR